MGVQIWSCRKKRQRSAYDYHLNKLWRPRIPDAMSKIQPQSFLWCNFALAELQVQGQRLTANLGALFDSVSN